MKQARAIVGLIDRLRPGLKEQQFAELTRTLFKDLVNHLSENYLLLNVEKTKLLLPFLSTQDQMTELLSALCKH